MKKPHEKSAGKSAKTGGKKSKAKRALLVILSILLILSLLSGIVYLVLYNKGKSKLLIDKGIDTLPTGDFDESPEIDDEGLIKYKGSTYRLNKNLVTLLFIGSDNFEAPPDTSAPGKNGQADALFLMAFDTESGKTDLLGISRDSMVDIDIFAKDGGFERIDRKQICLAYAYGDGKKKSCENVSRSVSRLLYGMPIEYYCAIDLKPVGILNDAVGGVSLSSLEDLKLSVGQVKKGQTITLRGEDARRYVQYRDTSKLDSNNQRMKRQQQYLTAFSKKALSMTKKDVTTPLRMYNQYSQHITTNLQAAEVTYLTSSALKKNSGGDFDFRMVKGEVVQGEKFAEFVVDETALFELILDVFYVKVS